MEKRFWDFLNSKIVSSNYSYDLKDHPEWDYKPENATFINGRWLPERPDGLTIGNENVFAAIGIPELTAEMVYEFYAGSGLYQYSICPSKMSFLVGPNKTFNHLKILYNTIKYQDFQISYQLDPNFSVQKNSTDSICNKILSNFDSKRLFRIKKTPIAIGDLSDNNIQIKIIDFSPTFINEPDPPVICRFVLLRNVGNSIIRKLNFGPLFVNYGSSFEIIPSPQQLNKLSFNIVIKSDNKHPNCFSILSQKHTLFTHDDLDAVNANDFLSTCESVELDSNGIKNLAIFGGSTQIKDLYIGDSCFIPYYFILGSDVKDLEHWCIKVAEWNPFEILMETYNKCIDWINQVPIFTSSNQINDAIDSILNLIKLQIGTDAIHTGSLYYDHDSAFVRDNYWIQRALSKAGRVTASKINLAFFNQCWMKEGFRNSYNTYSKKGGVSAKEMRVEIPAYLPLMVNDLWLWTEDKDILVKNFVMVKDCVDVCLSAPNDLFIINSDETWIWPAFVNELDYYFDSSMVMIAGIHAAEKTADLLNEQIIKEKWNLLRMKWTNALHKNYRNTNQKRYAVGIDHNGLQDLSLIPSVISRPILFGYTSQFDKDFVQQNVNPDNSLNFGISDYPSEYIQNGIQLIWDVMHPLKVIRSHSRTSSFVGNTPGYYLYAVSNLDLPFKDDVLDSVLSILDCTGSVYEIHDLYFGAWGTERRRIWDSAVILLGLLEYLFGVNPEENSILFNPHNPKGEGYSIISNLPIKGDHYQIASIASDFYYDLDDNPDFSYDTFDNPIRNIDFHFSSDDVIYSNFKITQVKIKRPNKSEYALLYETDLSGSVRYYPIIGSMEFGLNQENHHKPIVRFLIDKLNQILRIEIDPQLIDESFGISHEFGIIISLEWISDTNITCLIKNRSVFCCHLYFGNDLKEIAANEESSFEFDQFNADDQTQNENVESNLLEYNVDTNLLTLNEIFTWNGVPNIIILYDMNSNHHAIEILKEIAIIKAKLYPMKEFRVDIEILEQCCGMNGILVGDSILLEHLKSQSFELQKDFQSFQLWIQPDHPKFNLIFIPNQGNVYHDTHPFIEQMGIYLIPTRNKAMSMHPFGHFRLSDQIGMPASLQFKIEIKATKPINFYMGGNHSFGESISMIWDPTTKSTGIKPVLPYCLFYTMQPYAEIEVAAGGIATGVNCIRFVSECNANDPIEIIYYLYLDQTYHPIHLSGGQRERILDPTILKKNPDGSKILQIVMHPGRSVHPIINPNDIESKKRSFSYVFGRYPKHSLF